MTQRAAYHQRMESEDEQQLSETINQSINQSIEMNLKFDFRLQFGFSRSHNGSTFTQSIKPINAEWHTA
jgi:hypothetical protein